MTLVWPSGVLIDSVEAAGWADIVILKGQVYDVASDQIGQTLSAVWLGGSAVMWTYSFVGSYSKDDWVESYVDPWGIVVETHFNGATGVQVIDVFSGAVFATTDLGEDVSVVEVVSGMIVTNENADYCVRSVRAPQACQQMFDGSYLSTSLNFQPVFGAGRWINTDRGVFDLTTGQPATFGADARGYSPDGAEVRYIADRPDRVFRVECSHDSGAIDPTCTYQPWDPDRDKALGQAVEAGLITMTRDRSAFVAIKTVDGSFMQPALYSWPDAGIVWQDDEIKCVYTQCSLDIASATVTASVFMLSTIGSVDLVLDVSDGEVIKVDEPTMFPYGPSYALGGDKVVYLATDAAIAAYDGASGGFDWLWTLNVPNSATLITGAGQSIIALDDVHGLLWRLY